MRLGSTAELQQLQVVIVSQILSQFIGPHIQPPPSAVPPASVRAALPL